MNLISVDSRNIDAIGYNNSTLYVQFNTGRIYAYHNVPRHLYEELMSASSHGEFLSDYIKKGGFKYSRVD